MDLHVAKQWIAKSVTTVASTKNAQHNQMTERVSILESQVLVAAKTI